MLAGHYTQVGSEASSKDFRHESTSRTVGTHHRDRHGSAGNGRTTCHPGYAVSQTIRKRVEECFGWAKTISALRKSRFIGREKLDFPLS